MCFGYHVWKFLWNLLMMDLALETKLCVKYSSLCLLCCFLFGWHFSVAVQCIMFHCFSKSSTVWMCVEREGSMKRSLWTAPCFTRRSLCEFWQRFLLTFHMSPVLETLRFFSVVFIVWVLTVVASYLSRVTCSVLVASSVFLCYHFPQFLAAGSISCHFWTIDVKVKFLTQQNY